VKVEVGLKFEITFLTQHCGFVHILHKFCLECSVQETPYYVCLCSYL